MFSPHQDPPLILDRSLSFFFDQLPKSLRVGNPERKFWKSWQAVISLYGFNCSTEQYRHDRCWGWSIVRASYEDDEKFSRAVSAIHRLGLAAIEDEYRESRTVGRPDNSDVDAVVDQRIAGVQGHPNLRERVQASWDAMVGPAREALPDGEALTPDWVITNELARRYHTPVVQDRDFLEGADAATAWKYAHSMKLEEDGGARGAFFIYLDKDSIDLPSRAPGQEELASMSPDERAKTAWNFWVKVVDTACEVTEDGEDTDEMISYPLGRRRVRLYDFFDVFMRLCAGALHEMSVEGQWRQQVAGRGEHEWEFCEVPDWNGKRRKWLAELYGEEVRGERCSDPGCHGCRLGPGVHDTA